MKNKSIEYHEPKNKLNGTRLSEKLSNKKISWISNNPNKK
jgi:hypothetical protein